MEEGEVKYTKIHLKQAIVTENGLINGHKLIVLVYRFYRPNMERVVFWTNHSKKKKTTDRNYTLRNGPGKKLLVILIINKNLHNSMGYLKCSFLLNGFG